MRILRYANQQLWLIDTPRQYAAGFMALFRSLNEDWEVYEDLKEDNTPKYESVRAQIKYMQGMVVDLMDPRTAWMVAAKEKTLKEYKTELDELNKWAEQRKLWMAACGGDIVAAIDLLKIRQGYEYENWDIIDAEDPTLDMPDPAVVDRWVHQLHDHEKELEEKKRAFRKKTDKLKG